MNSEFHFFGTSHSHLQPPSMVMMTFKFASLIWGNTIRLERRTVNTRLTLDTVILSLILDIPLASRDLLCYL